MSEVVKRYSAYAAPLRYVMYALVPVREGVKHHYTTVRPSITTTVKGRIVRDACKADRRLAWERLARSLLHCVRFSHRSSSAAPNRSRGSISHTTR